MSSKRDGRQRVPGGHRHLDEVAALLAAGILRLRAAGSGSGASPEEQVRVDFVAGQSVCATDPTEKETAE